MSFRSREVWHVQLLASAVVLIIFGGIYGLYRFLPTGFAPPEDQGYLFVNVQLPNAASLERTQQH